MASAGSDLSTIGLEAPFEMRSEALATCVKQGDCIGKNKRFEITERLGKGGMGVVFAAADRQLDRSVAIKFILPAPHIPWDQLVKILRREAMATARLRHDNIVAIFDIATWKRVPYLVMEHLQGDSLAQMLAHDRLSLLRATEVMIDVARGMSHAHENGIVHRDLKPSNVFVLKGGRAKILDFGLAAFAQLPSQPSVSSGESNPNSGTPASMAPEQWRGDSQDERTDVWAMGVMLFQLFTGQRPYASTDAVRLYEEICSEQPAPSVLSVQDSLPEQAEMIVTRAMQKKPEARFQTAAQLLEALVGLHNVLTRSSEAKREARRILQRRQLTFLSCRLMSLATVAEDPDEEGESLSKFTALCADAVNTLNGRLVSVLGSRVLACFGHPIAREGDAERAVRAGLQIVKAVGRTPWQQGAAPPRVRVGIHTGLEIVEDVEGEPEAFHIQGTTPQIAASLESQADDDAVVIGYSTYQLAHSVFDLEHIGSLGVEGGPQPMAAYRVLREKDIDSRFDAAFASSQTPLVGREADVERLVELWQCARNSTGHFALLTGEAGIGKSRLVRVLKDRIGSDGVTRMSCQCWPQFKSSAFHAVIELVLRSTGILREDSTEHKIRKLESSLSSLEMDAAESMPVIASLLSISLPGTSDFSLDPRERKKRTIDTLTAMVLAMAGQRPVLFVAEDLHWADHSSLELLGALLERMASARILVLGTARPEFRTLWPNRAHFHQMPISHLPPRLAAEMIKRTAGDSKLPADVIESLVQRTEGVPLFIEEITRTLVDSVRELGDRAAVSESAFARAIPATLNELFLARLDRLTTATKELAQIAAVVGRSFPYALIQHMSGMGETALRDALFSLTEADVLLCQGRPSESKYQFKHSLIQDAAYHSLPKKKRRAHHLKVAHVLKELLPETAEIQPELLAHHYTEAGDVEQALGYWERAGRRAVERFANVEAISHFSQAIQMLAKIAEDPDRNRRELSLQLALGAPLMAVKGYAAPEVERAYARARELCRSASEDIQLFPAMQGLWQFYMVGGELPVARELAEQLLGVAQNSADSTLRLLAYRSLATTAFLQGEIVRCRELTEMGLALYDLRQHGSLGLRYGHDPGVAHGLYAAWALWLLGYPEQALEKAIEAVTLAEKLSHPVSMAFARCYLAVIHNSCGQYAEAAADAAAAKAVSIAHQLALWLSVGTMMEGWARFGLGEWEQGIALFQQGVAAWRRTGARAGMTFFLVTLAEAYRKAGLPTEGMAVLDEAEALVFKNSEHYYEAELYRVKGELRFALAPQDPAGAEADIEHAITIARQQKAKSLQLRATMSLCCLPHRPSRSEEIRQLLYDIYQSFSEGLGTADLLMARTALEVVSEARPNTSPD
ncbi:MAG TPA: protein kinase [Candidatus Dormibacteraeota bacterium]|nr:protein kinase [Candidatus Dormibacteraeota bacterium]